MAQHDYVIANGTGAAVRSDLNNALAAIVSQNSGATEPATTYAYQFWADTTTGSLKLRNSANSAWIELLQLDGTLTMEDGTEALPGLSFRNDLDTGLWRPGTNQLAISTNAVERVEFGASEVVFNDAGNNYDFRVEGDTNANLLFVDASADAVGIGTSSPAAQFVVGSGNTLLGHNTLDNYGGRVDIRSAYQARSANVAAQLFVADSAGSQLINTGGAIDLGGYQDSFSRAYSYARIQGLASASTGYGGYLSFMTQNAGGSIAERLRIDSSGNVGIGTQSPQQRLSVSKAGAEGVEWNPGAASNLNTEVHYNRSGSAFCGTSTQAAYHVFDLASSEAARIDTSGRLLVGTSTSQGKWNNSSGDDHLVQIESTNAFSQSWIAHSTSSSAGVQLDIGRSRGTSNGSTTLVNDGDLLGHLCFQGADGSEFVRAALIQAYVDGTPGANDVPGRLVFSTTADGASSPTERARITNLGALKASTTGGYSLASNAVHELRSNQNNRTVWVSNTNAAPYGLYVKYEGTDPNGTDNEFLVCDANGTVRASIRSNGGLANFSANNANLSDRNTKKDISPAAGTWDCIKEWEIVNYRYKDQPDDADLNLGVIAQQVAESCPEVITVFEEAKDDQPEKLGVKEQQMYWMAIKALQEAQVRIESLEATNADLLARVTALESA